MKTKAKPKKKAVKKRTKAIRTISGTVFYMEPDVLVMARRGSDYDHYWMPRAAVSDMFRSLSASSRIGGVPYYVKNSTHSYSAIAVLSRTHLTIGCCTFNANETAALRRWATTG